MKNLGLKLAGVGLMLPLGLAIGAVIADPLQPTSSQTVKTQPVSEVGGTQGEPAAVETPAEGVATDDTPETAPAQEENTGGGTVGAPTPSQSSSSTPSAKKTQEKAMSVPAEETTPATETTTEPAPRETEIEYTPEPEPKKTYKWWGEGQRPKECPGTLGEPFMVDPTDPCQREYAIDPSQVDYSRD